MTGASMGPNDVVHRLVETAWSGDVAPLDPDDPLVRGFAEFGLHARSPLATEEQLRGLGAWRDSLRIPPNSAFLDGTLLLTVDALLGAGGAEVLTPVTLWELTAFIDALVCFDRLYCIANPVIDVPEFNRRLDGDVLTAIPDPDDGMLRRVAAGAAEAGLASMHSLRMFAKNDDAWRQETQAVVDAWRAVLGPDFPGDGLFDISRLDSRLAEMAAPTASPADFYTVSDPYETGPALSAALADDIRASGRNWAQPRQRSLQLLIDATRLPQSPAAPAARPPLQAREQFAATATYRTYVNQGIANALALPYLPGTLRMPFRRVFVERAAAVQDELVTVALADQIFARQQPSSPLILPFFTMSVLQGATTREDVWAQMADARDRSVAFRRARADLDWVLERSQVSAQALRIQRAIRDEALSLADLAGAAQESASVALGVVAQTGIVPLTGALKIGIGAAQALHHGGGWARIWRRLFHRHEYFLAQTNSQAIALTNALPQVQQLWDLPKIGGYLKQFANAAHQMGDLLRG